jgi:hypothetical protein
MSFIQIGTCFTNCNEPTCGNQVAAHEDQSLCDGCSTFYREQQRGYRLDQLSECALYSKAFFNNVSLTPEDELKLFGIESAELKTKREMHEAFIKDPNWISKLDSNQH